ncbi:MAG: hypothetical protein ACERKN_02815 [Velocimicrobium sp.]
MREMEFKMERPGLIKEGDEVEILERSSSVNYHYIIEPAIAMSGCFLERERLKTLKGIVKEIKQRETGYYVIVLFDEDDVIRI